MKQLLRTGILIGLLAMVTSSALACGLMLTSMPYFIEEPVQQALISYDEENSSETLTVMPSFKSDANDFAWILPVPNLPLLAEGNLETFQTLRNLTDPIHHYRDGSWTDGCDRYDQVVYANAEDGVDIVDNQLVGYYQTMTLASDQAPALLDSLTQWGFLHDDNIDQANELITHYVQQGWYFVTVRIDSTSFEDSYPYGYNYYYGALQPLTLTFDSDEIIYPMRISALSAAESTELYLYIISDHRMEFPGASVQYANRFSQSEYTRVPTGSALRTQLQQGDYLTRLHHDFHSNQIQEDITIVRSHTDDEYLAIEYSGLPWTLILLLGPPLLWGLYRWITGNRNDASISS